LRGKEIIIRILKKKFKDSFRMVYSLKVFYLHLLYVFILSDIQGKGTGYMFVVCDSTLNFENYMEQREGADFSSTIQVV